MLFNSHIFLLVFLPLSLAGFYFLNAWIGKWAAINFVTLASLVFYSYWNPAYTLLIVASILFNFLLGRMQQQAGGGSKPLLISGIVVNLSVLGYYKYAHFAALTIENLTRANLNLEAIALPLAISFFTFTQIAYTVDVYRNAARAYRLREYCFFVLFFPHLIAGPIVRHYEILPQIEGKKLALGMDSLAAGLTILVIGLTKKVLLADSVAWIATALFTAAHSGHHPHFALAWIGALAYTCQIYFDFSGYSDMAIGLGLMFGVKLPLNFDSPYKSVNIVEFWRRWHMSLSRFLKDYLYIPMGGGRAGRVRKYINLTVTMLLGGLWHGAGWTFVIWGGLHGLYLVINHGWSAASSGLRWADTRVAHGVYRVVTFTAVVAAWVVFRAESLGDAGRILSGMAGLNGVVLPGFAAKLLAGRTPRWVSFGHFAFGVSNRDVALIASLLAIAFLAPNTQTIMRRADPAIEQVHSNMTVLSWSLRPAWACTAGIFLAIILCSLGKVSEFIYFRF